MNLRKHLYFALTSLRGRKLDRFYQGFLEQDEKGIPPGTLKNRLIQLLEHSSKQVPYYARIADQVKGSYRTDPFDYLARMPILTKELIRENYKELISADISRRKWFNNASGGSTGKPIVIIQDRDYTDQIAAITLLFSKLAGRELGELQFQLWGSLHDIHKDSKSLKSRFQSKLSNNVVLNAFQMSPAKMRDYLSRINHSKPKLILAYVSAIYDLAKFAERENISVEPQNAIMTSAGTLYPDMRIVVERVFKCRIFNRYGTREVGDIACERPGIQGLWVAPWGNYIEIVNDQGERVPDGQEGEIVVTSLTNYAMPLIRYKIGDRGVLSVLKDPVRGSNQQVFKEIIGRSYETFRKQDGSIINPAYFVTVLFYKDWIKQYQVIQKDFSHIVYKIVKERENNSNQELHEIVEKTRLIMGQDCIVDFDFVPEIPESNSGKYIYLRSEVSV